MTIPLSATPTGATLAFAPGSPTSVSFPTSEVGIAAPTVTFDLVNVGNAGASFTLGAPTSSAFSIATVTDSANGGGARRDMDPERRLHADQRGDGHRVFRDQRDGTLVRLEPRGDLLHRARNARSDHGLADRTARLWPRGLRWVAAGGAVVHADERRNRLPAQITVCVG